MINNNFTIKLKRSTRLCFTLSDDFKKYYEAGRDNVRMRQCDNVIM
jgi:hypothetical protein